MFAVFYLEVGIHADPPPHRNLLQNINPKAFAPKRSNRSKPHGSQSEISTR